jgi:chitinase domain-containing protein 1
LFADDRQKTLKEIQTFFDTKIAPKEIVDELKGIGKVLLPTDKEVKQAAAILEDTLSTTSLSRSKEPARPSSASTAFKGDEPPALDPPVPLEEFNLASMEGYTASPGPADLPQSTTPLSPYTQVTQYYKHECLCHLVKVLLTPYYLISFQESTFPFVEHCLWLVA